MLSKAQTILEGFFRTNDWNHPGWDNYQALFDAVIAGSDAGEMMSEETFMLIAKNHYANEAKIDEFYKQYDLLIKFFNYFKQKNNVIVVTRQED